MSHCRQNINRSQSPKFHRTNRRILNVGNNHLGENHSKYGDQLPCAFDDQPPQANILNKINSVNVAVRDSNWETPCLFINDISNNLEFLVDTGSALSLIPKTNLDSDCKPTDVILWNVNDTGIHTFGTKQLEIDLGLFGRFIHQFTIAGVNTPILGIDFLIKHKFLIDLKGKRLLRNNQKLNDFQGPPCRRSRGHTEGNGYSLCWYHLKYGTKAVKCQLPCYFDGQ